MFITRQTNEACLSELVQAGGREVNHFGCSTAPADYENSNHLCTQTWGGRGGRKEGERKEKGGRHGGMTKREKGHVDRERQLTPASSKIAIHSPARDPQLEKMETYEGEIGVVGAH